MQTFKAHKSYNIVLLYAHVIVFYCFAKDNCYVKTIKILFHGHSVSTLTYRVLYCIIYKKIKQIDFMLLWKLKPTLKFQSKMVFM